MYNNEFVLNNLMLGSVLLQRSDVVAVLSVIGSQAFNEGCASSCIRILQQRHVAQVI